MKTFGRWWFAIATVMLWFTGVHADIACGQNNFPGRRSGSAFGECPPGMTEEEFLARQSERYADENGEGSGSVLARFHGWVFRRYAGTVEMDTKTRYPLDYTGDYYFTPWQPSWIRGPVNPGLMRDQRPWIEEQMEGPYPLPGPPPGAHPGSLPYHDEYSKKEPPRKTKEVSIPRTARRSVPTRQEVTAPLRKEP